MFVVSVSFACTSAMLCWVAFDDGTTTPWTKQRWRHVCKVLALCHIAVFCLFVYLIFTFQRPEWIGVTSVLLSFVPYFCVIAIVKAQKQYPAHQKIES
jgi:hypothetical protein